MGAELVSPDLWIPLLCWLGALLLVILGFVGMVVPALPGPLLVLGGLMLAAWADDFSRVGWVTLLILSGLALLAMVLDVIAGALGAKRYGASRAAITGSLIGAVVGIFFGPLGLLLGPFAGAVAGELLSGRGASQAGLSGWGATLGMLLGTVAKIALGAMMLGVFAVAWLAG